MEAKLSVQIGAEISQLNKGMADAVKVVSNSANQIDKSTLKISKDFNDINKTKFTFGQNFQNESRKLNTSLSSTDTAIKKSKVNYLELGRVLQDLPFGISGIQNNLTQLIPSVGLAGLAFSAVISAITFASVGTDNWTRGLKNNKKSVEDLTAADEDYIDSLDQIVQSQLKGEQNAQKEITSLKTLFSAYQNANIPLSQRKEAYSEIQRLYPSYFENISFEEKASDKTTSAYNRLTNSILATAKARAAEDLITKNATKQLELEQKLVDLQNEKIKAVKNASSVIKSQPNFNPITGGGGGAATLNLSREQKELDEEIFAIAKQRNDLDNENLRLQKFVVQEIKNGADLTDNTAKKIKEIKTELQKTSEIDINSVFKPLEDDSLDKFNKNITDLLSNRGKSKLPEIIIPVPLEFQFSNTEQTSPADILKQKLEEEFGDDFRKNVSEIINSGIGSTLSNSFSQLGEALASGGNPIEAFGESVLQGFGSFLSEFGGLLIKYGIAATAYGKLQAALLTPGGAIIAGPLAIAAGLALKIASGAISGLVSGNNQQQTGYQIPQFANGVTNFSGGMALVGERGPELVNLPTGSNVITNQNVRRYMSGNNGNTQVFIPEARIKGQDIVISYNRTNKNLNRVT